MMVRASNNITLEAFPAPKHLKRLVFEEFCNLKLLLIYLLVYPEMQLLHDMQLYFIKRDKELINSV